MTALRDWAPLKMVVRNAKQSKRPHRLGPSLVRAMPKRSPCCQPPLPPAGGVGGYNHRDNDEEVQWRPPLLYSNPLGHRVPASLFIARFMTNDISGDHYEMIGKVAFGVSRPGGGCAVCVGVNIA